MIPLALCAELLKLLCAGFGFVYGVKKTFKKGAGLFIQIVVCAMGCLALGCLFSVVNSLVSENEPHGFNVGMLGTFGCYLFLFSASYGQMDGLIDGGEEALRKYRRRSLITPAAIALCYILILLSPAGTQMKCIFGVFSLILMLLSYYNTKHILIPDVEHGILRSIRSYNITALAFTGLNVAQMIFQAYAMPIPSAVTGVLISGVCGAVVPILESGVKKWTI